MWVCRHTPQVSGKLFGVLLFLTNIFTASCQQKGSLTFVIDNTASMQDSINQVIKNADAITEVVLEEKISQIKNMVLVTFNDPGRELKIITEDRKLFKNSINSIAVHGGGDCPEPSLSGLLLGLRNSLPGSYVYVFTDASAKDHWQSNQIKNLCQKKQIQVNFVVTGFCASRSEPGFQVYYDIATASSGLMFYVGPNDVGDVVTTIKETISGNKTAIKATKVPPNQYVDIPFVIDDETEYAVVTASGSDVELKITGPKATQSKILWINNAKVMKLSDLTPGTYTATVKGSTETSVYISGRTDFVFSHGFSELEPNNIRDTTPQPIANAKTHLSISFPDPKHKVKVVSAQILDMNDKVILELPLKPAANDLYTTEKFVAPSHGFKIAVRGKDNQSGKDIIRMAKIPITPQEPPKPESRKPVVKISEGGATEMEYGKTAKLTCRVTAYPAPEIVWKTSSGAVLPSQSSVVEPPFEYISYLTIPAVKGRNKYSCHATNNQGSASSIVEVVAKDLFHVDSAIEGKTKVNYGEKATLKCDISSPKPMHIYWILENEEIGATKQLVASDEYEISADGKHLTIKNMDLHLAGKYTCKASLDDDNSKFVTFSTKVNIPPFAPLIKTKAKIYKGAEGDAVLRIPCDVIGVPPPMITWRNNNGRIASNEKYTIVNGALLINNPNPSDSRYYVCRAKNSLGVTRKIFKAEVVPKTISKKPAVTISEGRAAEVEYGKPAKLTCRVSAYPAPTIVWKNASGAVLQSQSSVVEAPSEYISYLTIPDVKEHGKYTCHATNDQGSAYSTVEVVVKGPFQVDSTIKDETKVKYGEKATLKCDISSPMPMHIYWFLENEKNGAKRQLVSSDQFEISADGKQLTIKKMDLQLAGKYICKASLDEDTSKFSTFSTKVNIPPFAPVITTKTKEYEGAEGDSVLRIPCDATGVPQPVITWRTADGKKITPNERYSIVNGALLIKNPKPSDTELYVCEAKNSIGETRQLFNVEVDPKIDDGDDGDDGDDDDDDNVREVSVLEGASMKIECGQDGQSVRWFIDGEDLNINKRFLTVEDIDFSKEGNYSCRVSDKNGSYMVTYRVTVGYPPVFSFPQEDQFDWNGSEYQELDCQVDSKPVADVVWKYNGKVLPGEKSQVLSVPGNWGKYTCNVTNVHGSVQRSFDVKSTKCLINRKPQNDVTMPLILAQDSTWPVIDTTTNYLVVAPGQKLKFVCPNQKGSNNALQKFLVSNEITATCVKQDEFTVNGKPFKVSDFYCSREVEPVVVKEDKPCLTTTSKLIRVGYKVPGFLENYETCFDTSKNMPIYTRVTMHKTNRGPAVTNCWHAHPDVPVGQFAAGYTCTAGKSRCCYSKTQLVNARDFSDGPAQRGSHIDPLNAIPYWRPCDGKDPWMNIEDNIRSQLSTYPEFMSWSGIHKLQEMNGKFVPRYLWKVVRFDDEDSLAVVYINDAAPTKQDVLCKNKCVDDNVPWMQNLDERTYCCDVNDFLKAFSLSGTSVGKPVANTQ